MRVVRIGQRKVNLLLLVRFVLKIKNKRVDKNDSILMPTLLYLTMSLTAVLNIFSGLSQFAPTTPSSPQYLGRNQGSTFFCKSGGKFPNFYIDSHNVKYYQWDVISSFSFYKNILKTNKQTKENHLYQLSFKYQSFPTVLLIVNFVFHKVKDFLQLFLKSSQTHFYLIFNKKNFNQCNTQFVAAS